MLVPKDIKCITANNKTIVVFKVPVGKELSSADVLTANIYGVGAPVKLGDQRRFDYHVKVLRPALDARNLTKGVHILDTPVAICKVPVGTTEGALDEFTSAAQILQGTLKINDTGRYAYWSVALTDVDSEDFSNFITFEK
jgi:hypothetical protein